MRFKARAMEFMDRPKKVVLRKNRGASALTSISNCLILTNGFSLDSHDANEAVESSYLERCISRRVFDCLKDLVPPTDESKSILQTFFDITKKLSTGIEVNPVAGTAEFEASRQCEFFSILGIPLLHASTFNEQVISTLQVQLEQGQIGILYLNDKFNTICKHNENVYLLIEDERIHTNNPSASWKTIVNQKEIFVTSDFSYITAHIDKKLYKCSTCFEEFYTNINYERHIEIHMPSSKANMNHLWNEDTFVKYWDEILDEDAYNVLSCGDETVKKSHGSPVESIIKKWITSPEFHVTPPEVKDAVKKLKYLKGKKPSSNVLLSILKVASEGTFMSTNLLNGKLLFVKADKSENMMRSMLAYFSLKVEESLVTRNLGVPRSKVVI